MLRKTRFILCTAVLLIVQVTVVQRFTYRSLRPDLLVLAAAFLSLEAGYKSALWCPFIIGVVRDLGAAGPLGLSPLLLVPASAGLHLLKEHLVRESAWTDLLLTFGYALACALGWAVLTAAFTQGTIAELAPRSLGQATFTAALSPLFFLAFARLRIVQPHATP